MTMKTIVANAGESMSGLNLFGLLAVTVMVVSYALESRHSAFVMTFAVSCALASVYGFLQGAWPFGIVEAIWSVVAANRWYTAARKSAKLKHTRTSLDAGGWRFRREKQS